jgi:hypothetical protein
MAVRFRIRTSAGQELSFASHEMFEDFVRAGDLSPDDLVYDGETGSWSPARTHPIVLEIEYEREAGEEARPSAAGAGEPTTTDAAGTDEGDLPADAATGDMKATESEGEAPPVADLSSDALGLDLAPVEERTPEEEAQAFLRRMEAERDSDIDGGGPRRIEGFTKQDSSKLAGKLEPPAPERPSPPSPPPVRKKPVRTPPAATARRAETIRRPEPPRRESPPSKGAEPAAPGGRRLFVTFLALAVVAGGAYVAYSLRSDAAPAPESEPEVAVEPMAVEPEPEPEPPPREPVIASTEAAVRERAQERFLTATQSQLRDLEPIPEAWASGPYLAVPSDHPEIVDVWQSYLATVLRVRAGDAERYRAAYVAALDDAAVGEEARQGRLAAAMSDFDAAAPPRAAHWDRVEALADAALRSHNVLVEAEGLILYDPAVAGESLGSGTSGRDADAQLLLRQVIELLAARLAADGLGPRVPERVREWVWDGFLDAATR